MALDEIKTLANGHAPPTDARMAVIERRLTTVAESSEARVAVLRDAIADFVGAELASRDEEIALLKEQVADLQQKLEQQASIDQRVHEISTRLEEKQQRRDRGKNDGDLIQTVGIMIAQERQSARKEFKVAIEETQRALGAKLVALEEPIVQRTEQRIIQHIEQCYGRTNALSNAIATEQWDRQKEVKAAVEEAQRAVDLKLEALEQRLKAVPGKLPVAKIWRAESVTYQAEFVCHEGALWQARKDTAQAPGGSVWICVARAGRDGCDGRSPNVCGTYDVREKYERLDVVAFDGAAFIARRDNPGLCPGDGWQLLMSRAKTGDKGQPGPRGERGDKGERGEPGALIVGWKIDRPTYRAFPVLEDGQLGPELNLRELFEQYHEEVH